VAPKRASVDQRYSRGQFAEITEALMASSTTPVPKRWRAGGARWLVTVILTLGTGRAGLQLFFNVSRGAPAAKLFCYISWDLHSAAAIVPAVPVRSHLLELLPHVPGVGLRLRP